MALTKDFRETIRERAQQESQFRKALLREAIELMLSGDEKTGRAILRNYINATVRFRQSEEAHPFRPTASCARSGRIAILPRRTCLVSSLIFRRRKA